MILQLCDHSFDFCYRKLIVMCKLAFRTDADTLPPSKVLDLTVKQNNFGDFTEGIALSFTAPGDDYDNGTGE